jgi:hypothetical protein
MAGTAMQASASAAPSESEKNRAPVHRISAAAAPTAIATNARLFKRGNFGLTSVGAAMLATGVSSAAGGEVLAGVGPTTRLGHWARGPPVGLATRAEISCCSFNSVVAFGLRRLKDLVKRHK